MNKILLIGFFCLFSAQTQAAIDAQIDASEISPDESFRLMIIQNNPKTTRSTPDLTPLKKDFFILGTAQNMSYSIINGYSQSSTTWIVSLQPQRSGSLIIPSIQVGTEQTVPLTINVTATPNMQNNSSIDPVDQQQEEVMLNVEVNEKKPYVNQQITYKVTLYSSKQLVNAQYQEPKVENALLFPLGDAKRYQTQRYNTQYLVQEQNYAVFPQKSGPLKITSPVLVAMTYDAQPQKIKVSAKPITLTVQPIPPKYKGTTWLPAKHIKLTEHYDQSEQTINEGGTLIRTVTIEGVGIPAQLLPALNFSSTDALSAYTEKGSDKNQITQGELISKTEIKVTYLFNKSGKITIPKLKLPWFNTVTEKEETITLPPKTIEVISASTTTAPKKNKLASIKNKEHNSAPQKIHKSSTANNISWIITALFALAWLITLILWKWQKRTPNTKKTTYKTTKKALHRACLKGTPQNARDALLKWANTQWPDAQILNLTDLTLLSTDKCLKKQIQILSQALYKDPENNLWHGDELWHCIQRIKQTNSNLKNKNDILPPINPS